MQMLDIQIAQQRAKRRNTPKRRATFLAAGVLFIIVGTLVALMILQQMAEQVPRGRQVTTPENPERVN